jgi:adenylate kinase
MHPQLRLMKRVILITGTPCTGKTTTAKHLATTLNAQYINLTDYAKANNLTLGKDKERKTTIINEEAMRQKLRETIQAAKADIIIDGHYAAAVTPPKVVTHVFVLRRSPKELKAFMKRCGFEGAKLWENLSAEILDSCLIEALQNQEEGKICEIDATAKTVEQVSREILDFLEKRKPCCSGFVDWLGMLEREGVTDEYLKA